LVRFRTTMYAVFCVKTPTTAWRKVGSAQGRSWPVSRSRLGKTT